MFETHYNMLSWLDYRILSHVLCNFELLELVCPRFRFFGFQILTLPSIDPFFHWRISYMVIDTGFVILSIRLHHFFLLKLINNCLLRLDKAKILLLRLFKWHAFTRASIFKNIINYVSLSFWSLHWLFEKIHFNLRHYWRFSGLKFFWLWTDKFKYLKVFRKLLYFFNIEWK